MTDLKDKTIIVTGGNSGIGFAAAKKIAEAGGTPIIVGQDQAKIDDACTKIGATACGFKADISSLNELDALYRFVQANFHTLDGMVINAGVFIPESCENITEESFNKTINVNLKGSFFTAQKGLPLMSCGGSIVFIASLSAHKAFANTLVYSATKAAVMSMAATMALELANKNIRVNSISPGSIRTPILNKLGMTEDQINAFFDSLKQKIPLRRPGSAEDVAKAIAFLLSNDSAYVTGTDLTVDGGLFLG
jgi:NAD(P)-dependent dehydrogenase (short-subunit alcohol dehydrogenase family)